MSQSKAINIAKKNLPKGKIQKIADYKNWFLFVIFTPDPYEGQMDAIYSVDKRTGQFMDFPYMKDEYFHDVIELFKETPKWKG